MAQVFMTDMNAKFWKSLYTFKWIHIDMNNHDQKCKIFVWICIHFGVYEFSIYLHLKFVSKTIEYIKNQHAFYEKYKL